MNKKWFYVIYITFMLIVLFNMISNSSFAYEYKNEKYTLFYKDNMNELSNDISIFLDEIDNYILPNATYMYSNVLTENYDFLCNFAISYIINNREIFNDEIKMEDNNLYVEKDLIYDITNKYFGIKDFQFINSNQLNKDGLILLEEYNEVLFNNKIVSVNAYKMYQYVNADVSYENGDNYRYIFKNNDGILKLYDVEVLA